MAANRYARPGVGLVLWIGKLCPASQQEQGQDSSESEMDVFISLVLEHTSDIIVFLLG